MAELEPQHKRRQSRWPPIPLLRQLAWHVQGTGTLSTAEAAALNARQRRRLDLEPLQPHERQLISTLQQPAGTNDVPACQAPRAAPAT
ncbi:MAG: hypothetical protein VKK05_09150 [Synechococcus sp.]|nr:hypothetical protein [Synechococcus sp.]